MSGNEIRKYLEASYDRWIKTIPDADGHLLNIEPYDDPRTGSKSWSFVERAYNFDSAGGLVYTVDVTKPAGSRVRIISLAGGKPFDLDATYSVAMTSYRACGGGDLLKEAGVDTDRIEERIQKRYPEYRALLYDYLKTHGSIDPAVTGDPAVIGHWSFVPENIVKPAMEKDFELLFPYKK